MAWYSVKSKWTALNFLLRGLKLWEALSLNHSSERVSLLATVIHKKLGIKKANKYAPITQLFHSCFSPVMRLSGSHM
jgi:hypothetical protein